MCDACRTECTLLYFQGRGVETDFVVTFEASTRVKNIFVKEATLDIQGNLKSYVHQSESGNRTTKKFCDQCGCQMFSFNEGRPGLVRIHAGTVNELEVVKPQGDVWISKKIPSIKMNENLDKFEKNFT